MSRQAAVGCFDCPVVIHPLDIFGAGVYHRLDGQCHTLAEQQTSALLPEIRHLRILVKVGADTVADQIFDNAVTEAFGVIADGGRDLVEMVMSLSTGDAAEKALLRDIHQFLCLCRYTADAPGAGGVTVIALPDQTRIQRNNIALLQDAPL